MSKSLSMPLFVVCLALFLLLLAGCVAPAAMSTAPQAPLPGSRVYFAEPGGGAPVASPVKVKMNAENFIIEPAGEIKTGAGHLHIIVDAGCIEAGAVVPKDETHLHYGQGQIEAELELAPGEHTLCLQAADGAHIALPGEGMTEEITITVQ